MGKRENFTFTTKLDIKECAHVFREAMENGRSGIGKILGGVSFSQPAPSDDPFEILEQAPDFQVVAHCPRNRFNDYAGYAIHCYVWDTGSERRVSLHRVAAGNLDVSSSRRSLEKVVQDFRNIDPALAPVPG